MPTLQSLVASHPLPRRSFLFFTGSSAALGSLWLAGCTKKEEPKPVPAPVPTIASFSPGSGAPGAAITLTGTHFTGTTAVTVGGVAASFTVVNATTLTFMVPAGSQTGAVVLTTAAGSATSSSSFTVLPALATVTITGFTPGSAAPGTTVTLTGSGFAGATAVAVGGTAAVFTVVNATTITLTVPTGAQTGAITVTTPGGTTTSSMPFTVLAATVNVGTGDLGVLNYAYALEQLEAAFYTRVRTGAYYTGLAASSAEKQVLDDLYYHEVIHRDFLKAAITANMGTPIKDLDVNFNAIDFNSRASVLGAAKSFEDLGVAAYNGAARFLNSPLYLALASKIVSVEARHAALVRDLVVEGSFVDGDVVAVGSTGLEMSKTPANVANVVNAFLAPGSRLDVSGLV